MINQKTNKGLDTLLNNQEQLYDKIKDLLLQFLLTEILVQNNSYKLIYNENLFDPIFFINFLHELNIQENGLGFINRLKELNYKLMFLFGYNTINKIKKDMYSILKNILLPKSIYDNILYLTILRINISSENEIQKNIKNSSDLELLLDIKKNLSTFSLDEFNYIVNHYNLDNYTFHKSTIKYIYKIYLDFYINKLNEIFYINDYGVWIVLLIKSLISFHELTNLIKISDSNSIDTSSLRLQ